MHTSSPDPDRLAQAKATVLALVAQLPADVQLWEALATVLRPWVEAADRPRRTPPQPPGGPPEPGS